MDHDTHSTMHVRPGRPEDKAAIIDFADYVFSKAHRPHDFATLIPKLYGPDVNTSEAHWLVTDDADTRILSAIYSGNLDAPISPEWWGREDTDDTPTGPDTLRINGIGTVSVHARERGKRYMRALMHRAIDQMKADGVAVSLLSGQRQRYGYYGYEPITSYVTFNVSQTNIAKAFGADLLASSDSGTLRPVDPGQDDIAPLYAIYRRKSPISMRTPEDFVRVAQSWASDLYVFERAGEVRGYIIKHMRQITEFMPKRGQDTVPMLAAFLRDLDIDETDVILSTWQYNETASLLNFCEHFEIASDASALILDWVAVMGVALEIKHRLTPMPDARLTITITDQPVDLPDTTFHIAITNGRPTVASGPAPADRQTGTPVATVEISYAQAVRLFFTPFGAYSSPAVPLGDRHALTRLGGFPLALPVYRADMV